MKNKNEENYLLLTIVKFVAIAFKWIFLACSVTYIALTSALVIFSIIGYSSMTAELISNLSFLYGEYSISDITEYIGHVGKIKTIVGIVAEGFATSITYVILYNIASIAVKFLQNVEKNKIFTRENLEYLKDSTLLVLLFTFAKPIITFIANCTTDVPSYSDSYIPCGISIVLLLFVVKIVFEYGVGLKDELDIKKKEISELKSDISDMKISKIKEETKEVKKEVKEKKAKTTKTTKKATTK